ncbi:MAG TPA: NAD(+)/NADH kinase [Vicinamibacteria bacterium]|nr:NAD(+)/NADH kinase [Vicinamibacteria bacterium]
MSTIGLLVRPDLGQAAPAVRGLVAWLHERGFPVCLEERTAELVNGPARSACRVSSGREVAATADVLVVLGGDGTLLAASHLVERPVPVLGVNFGSLGFLTEITMAELYPTLEGVLRGEYRYEERRMLRARVQREGAEETTGDVLNDVVVTKASLSRIIELEVSVDGLFVSAFRADGLIVSSPTGSTAYNLAAGGPILHTSLDAVVLTPICPHMLTNRPLVVSDRSTIEVRLRSAREGEVHITLDGQRGFPLGGGDMVTVTRSPRAIRLVKASRDYFEVLRTKLKWGEPQRPR